MNGHATGFGTAGEGRRLLGRLWWKRPLDLTAASAILLATGPMLALLALAVRLESPGPAFYRQERVGRFGRRFRILKLRTMYLENDVKAHREAALSWFSGLDNGNGYKSLADRRITRLGRFLRRTSLDELPQMLNVLRGEMSLVGPRPAIPYELDFYQPQHFTRQNVPPGVTGLWQVSGRERLSAQRMMELDADYIRQASLSLDLKIIFKTGPAVIRSALKAR